MRIIIQFNGILMFNFNFKDMRESFIIMFFIRRVSMFILMENSRQASISMEKVKAYIRFIKMRKISNNKFMKKLIMGILNDN